MTFRLLDFSNMDIKNIGYSNPEKIKGSYICNLNYNNEDIYIKTPPLTNLTDIKTIDNKSVFELSFDESNKSFYEFLTTFDDHNILNIHKNSETWFNKEFPLDVVEDFFTSSVKHKSNPKLKLKLYNTKNTNLNTFLIYDKDNKIISSLNKGCKLICILKFNGLKFLSQQVISEWLPIQIKTDYISENNTFLISDNLSVNDNVDSNAEQVMSDSKENLEPDVEPVVESASEPVVESASEPVAEPVVEPVSEPVYEPVAEPVVEPDVEPVVEPVAEPVVETIKEKLKTENDSDEYESKYRDELEKSQDSNKELEYTEDDLKEIQKTKLLEYESENNLEDLSSKMGFVTEYETIINQTKKELEKYKSISESKDKELQEFKNKLKNFF